MMQSKPVSWRLRYLTLSSALVLSSVSAGDEEVKAGKAEPVARIAENADMQELPEGSLDLAGHAPQGLPRTLSEWPYGRNITILNLRENGLDSLPGYLALLPLRAIDLCANRFNDIPEVVRNIPTLKLLSLQGNNIRTVTTFCGLKHLLFLDLSQNPLTTLPQDTGSLQDLRTLMVVGTSLTEDSVSKIKEMESLRLLVIKNTPLTLEMFEEIRFHMRIVV